MTDNPPMREDWPMDEALLAALAHGMPPCAGIAMGFDRLAMIGSDAPSIDHVRWLPDPPAHPR